MPPSPDQSLPGSPSRDPRIDMFRGLALVTIFINHVPGTAYEQFTSRNFGFSDAAEAFVFMSGLAAGLAYSPAMRERGMVAAALKIWARARQLYFVHLATTVIALAIFAAAALWFGRVGLLGHNNLGALFTQPLAALIGLPLLSYQLGYLNILPLYILLLLATPALLWVAIRAPWPLLAASATLWAYAGWTGLTLRTFPGGGAWFLNPFAWQFLFTVGLVSGVRMRQGGALVPFSLPLVTAAGALVVGIALWMKIPAVGEAGRAWLGQIDRLGAPDFLVWFNKNTLAFPRLLHALALFYFLSSLVMVRAWSGASVLGPLRVLGKHSLAVFATGSVLALTLQAVRWEQPADPVRDGLLLACGLGLQLLLAYALEWTGSRPTGLVARARSAPLSHHAPAE